MSDQHYFDMLSAFLDPIKTAIFNFRHFIVDLPFYICFLIECLAESITRRICAPKILDNSDIILVTGAASGIGQQSVYKFAKRFPEAIYVLWDINEKGLMDTVDKCRKEFGAKNIHTFVVDLSKHQEIVNAAKLVREQVGFVTTLWNNAGISIFQPFLESDVVEEKLIQINLLSYMWTVREFLPDMIQMGRGHLVNTCSGLGFYRCRNLASYCASKFGLRGFLESLKFEMHLDPRKPNIKFSTIYPGQVRTAITNFETSTPNYKFKAFELLDVNEVAEEIVDGILKEKEEIFVPSNMKVYLWIYRILPTHFVNRVENHICKIRKC